MAEKRRVRIDLEYMGGRYAGFQWQDNALAIQQVVEQALEKLVNHQVRLNASGRTDAGVHAELQPTHADITTRMTDTELKRGLNSLLPWDIQALDVRTVHGKWNSRGDAKWKTYRYVILNREFPSVFDHGRVWHVKQPLDMAAMRAAAAHFIGEHDFSSFRSAGCSGKSPIKNLTAINIEKTGDKIVLHVTANGFLKQMVRNIVGTLAHVGKGKMKVEQMDAILVARDRQAAGPCAPAEGLCLVGVIYQDDLGEK
ncbi:MAG: tRNA pseudouridine(38-40) synthase TruA [Nitrospinota bacterium]|nr:tRNA pseudouridine(38-40) synthase TruA [Nitrospinota bacterium]